MPVGRLESLSQSLMDGLIILSVTKWIVFPTQEHMRYRMNVATAPKVAGKSSKRCRKNIPSIIVTSTCWGSIDLTLGSTSFKSLTFGVFCKGQRHRCERVFKNFCHVNVFL